jgi:hypothetical protein
MLLRTTLFTVLATYSIIAGSGRSLVVVVKTAQHWHSLNPPFDRRRSWDRLLLVERLMRPGLVVKADVLGDDMTEVSLAEDQDMVEELTTKRADEALGERVHVWGARQGTDHARANGVEHRSEPPSKLRVPIADEQLRRVVHRRVSSLLGAPRIRRRAGHGGVDDHASAKIDDEEDEELAKPEVVDLHEVACPRHMVSDERRPALSVSGFSRVRHVSLDRALAHADPELEELSANPLCSPTGILRCHLSDERRSRRGRASQSSRPSPPECSKTRAMPPQDRRWLHEERYRSPRGGEPGGDGHGETLPWRPTDASSNFPLGNDELLPEHGVLCDERHVRPKQIRDQPANEPDEVDHQVFVV